MTFILYFFIVVHKAACQTLLKAFYREGRGLLVLEMFLTKDSQAEDLLLVLLPVLKPACYSAMIFSTCGVNLFSMIFSMTAWMADEADW